MSATVYNFQLVLSGVHELSDDLAEAIFMAFEGDANLSSRGGTVTVDFFEWEFTSDVVQELFGIVRKVKQAVSPFGADVVRVLPDDLVTAAEIAQKIGISREAVRLYAAGKRGDGMFPAPAHASASNRSVLWRWGEVLDWAMEYFGPDHPSVEEGTAEYRAWYRQVLKVSLALNLFRHAGEASHELLNQAAAS